MFPLLTCLWPKCGCRQRRSFHGGTPACRQSNHPAAQEACPGKLAEVPGNVGIVGSTTGIFEVLTLNFLPDRRGSSCSRDVVLSNRGKLCPAKVGSAVKGHDTDGSGLLLLTAHRHGSDQIASYHEARAPRSGSCAGRLFNRSGRRNRWPADEPSFRTTPAHKG